LDRLTFTGVCEHLSAKIGSAITGSFNFHNATKRPNSSTVHRAAPVAVYFFILESSSSFCELVSADSVIEAPQKR
jgi:hypothetical protein